MPSMDLVAEADSKVSGGHRALPWCSDAIRLDHDATGSNRSSAALMLWSSRLLLGGARFQLVQSGLLPAKQGGPIYRFYRRFATFCIVLLIHIHWACYIILGTIAEGRGSPNYGMAFMLAGECMFLAFTPVYVLVQRYIESEKGLQFLAHGLCKYAEHNATDDDIPRERISQLLSDPDTKDKFMKWYPLVMQCFVAFSLSTNIATCAILIWISSEWTDNLNEYKMLLYFSHVCLGLYVLPHQGALFTVTLFLPWLVCALHCKDLDQFQNAANELFEAFSSQRIAHLEFLQRLSLLEGSVALRCKRTSSYWSPIIILMIAGLACFGLGMAYVFLLSDQIKLIERAPLLLSYAMKSLVYVFSVVITGAALSLATQLARVTDASYLMMKSFETLYVMGVSHAIWGDSHAYVTHLRRLDLSMQVMGRDFSLASVLNIVSTLVVGIFFVFLSETYNR